MNKIFAIATIVSMYGSSVFAGNFDDNTFTLEATYNALDVSVDMNSDEVTEISVGTSGLEHSLGVFSASVGGQLSYDLTSESVGVRGEYNLAYETDVTIYGGTAVEYYTPDESLASGDWMFEPTIGVSEELTDSFSVYAEVSYAWDMSNSWDSLGGTVEAGLPISVTNSLTLTPSVARGFDSDSEDWSANITASIKF